MSKRTQLTLLTTNGVLVIAPLLFSMGYAVVNGLKWENFGLFLMLMTGLVPMVYKLEEVSRIAVVLLTITFCGAIFLLNAVALRRSKPALVWTAFALLVASYAGAALQFLMGFHPG
jgi:hypothetical protein